jgi:hypothetical protein
LRGATVGRERHGKAQKQEPDPFDFFFTFAEIGT